MRCCQLASTVCSKARHKAPVKQAIESFEGLLLRQVTRRPIRHASLVKYDAIACAFHLVHLDVSILNVGGRRLLLEKLQYRIGMHKPLQRTKIIRVNYHIKYGSLI